MGFPSGSGPLAFAQGPIGTSFALGSKVLNKLIGTPELSLKDTGLATAGALALGAGALYGPGGAAYSSAPAEIGGAGYMSGETALPAEIGNYGTADSIAGLSPIQQNRLGTMLKIMQMGQPVQAPKLGMIQPSQITSSKQNRRR